MHSKSRAIMRILDSGFLTPGRKDEDHVDKRIVARTALDELITPTVWALEQICFIQSVTSVLKHKVENPNNSKNKVGDWMVARTTISSI
jgi:hypothetical protein